jgi:hypothetical protein
VNLQVGQVYYSKSLGRLVIYVSRENYKGMVYYNFYEPTMRLFHWLDPQDVTNVMYVQ